MEMEIKMEMAVPGAKNRRSDPNSKRRQATISDGLPEETTGENHPEENRSSMEWA